MKNSQSKQLQPQKRLIEINNQFTLHKGLILRQCTPKFNHNNMGTPPEKPVAETSEQQAGQPETASAEGITSLPMYYKLEDITSVGPDLTDNEAACKGMPFAATYFGFWELHRAFFEAIRANQLQEDDTKQAMAAAKGKAKTRFINGYESMPRMTPEELDDSNDFFGSIFKTGVTNGATLFTEWTKTPEGQRELIREAAPMMLRTLISPTKKRPEA